ncbi:helix-turn-helix transcriptional regulator [Tianweitania sp.]|uniref:helix-turn-helix domain-containing protein n=1 Tax=Tianweitania sp. TaxID=2021634 RepID=UPI00289AA1EE|nr:helix-turn-helix transcriptional regulator [Tianweitania sp.]
MKLRKQTGKWLQRLREAAGLSQGELSKALGMRCYSFVSQVEYARVPPGQLGQWADALNIPPRQFAITLMSHYDPVNYKSIFEGNDAPTASGKEIYFSDCELEG